MSEETAAQLVAKWVTNFRGECQDCGAFVEAGAPHAWKCRVPEILKKLQAAEQQKPAHEREAPHCGSCTCPTAGPDHG